MRRADAPDRGSATVIVLAIMGLAVGVILVSALIAGIAAARAQAQTAADLGAIAAAHEYEQQRVTFRDDQIAACARGGEVVRKNGADVLECLIQEDRSVIMRVATPAGLGHIRVEASARAGPVDQP